MAECLSHVRVLDISRVFAGPWAAQMLADLGADVIKIEHIAGGDDARRMGVRHDDGVGGKLEETSSFIAMNRGKRSLAVDLAQPSGQEIVRGLARKCDVLIENFKVGNMARFGLDHENLRKVNPRLVYCSITGFGQDGPKRNLPGYDPIFQAMSGLMSVTGMAQGTPGAGPALTGYSVCDINAGLYAVIAILAALNKRDSGSGVGEYIDIALLDTQIHAASHIPMNYFSSRQLPVRNGTASQVTCPWQAFECADKSIVIAVGTDMQFGRLALLLEQPELATDARFATNADRICNKEILVPMLDAAFSRKPAAQWIGILEPNGISCALINDFSEVFEEPQVRARGLLKELTLPGGERARYVANPIRFSGTAPDAGLPPPSLGQHTQEVLTQLLGMNPAAIEALRAANVIR
ncbi:CoA transferase [bacterium]|nr:CoA transferase [bacterium]